MIRFLVLYIKIRMQRSAFKYFSLWVCMLLSFPACALPSLAGHVSFSKGSNAAQLPGAAPRILGKDAEIFETDNIQTTERSFVIVEFVDGAKVTVRPDSNFTVDLYNNQSEVKSAQLVLHEGSVNASTGDIAKDKPQGFQIKTPTSTVKSATEKSEFTIGICNQECEDRAKEESANAERTEKSIVARVVEIKGQVGATNHADKDAKERPLSLGKPLYNSDSIHSEKDSYALMVFPDGQKVTLQASSDMDIRTYNYQIKNKKDQIVFALTTGGMRTLTGSIGKADHSAYALDTPVATIGIRGTGTDTQTDGKSTVVANWSGIATVTNPTATVDVPTGSSCSASNPNEPPKVYVTPPSTPVINAPRPDIDKTDPKTIADNKPATKGETSISVASGTVSVNTAPATSSSQAPAPASASISASTPASVPLSASVSGLTSTPAPVQATSTGSTTVQVQAGQTLSTSSSGQAVATLPTPSNGTQFTISPDALAPTPLPSSSTLLGNTPPSSANNGC
ncbi:MAG: FecR domain-containing protein [Methylococcales bacterium]